MIRVSKGEIEFLRKHDRDLEWSRTMIQDSKRHHYWVAEKRNTLALLDEYWESRISEHYENNKR